MSPFLKFAKLALRYPKNRFGSLRFPSTISPLARSPPFPIPNRRLYWGQIWIFIDKPFGEPLIRIGFPSEYRGADYDH